MAISLREAREALAAKQAAIGRIYDQATANSRTDDKTGDKIYDLSAVEEFKALADNKARFEALQQMHDEAGRLNDDVRRLVTLEAGEARNKRMGEALITPETPAVFPGKQTEPVKGLGDLFVESKAFSDARDGRKGMDYELPDVDVKGIIERKTLFITSDGWAPETTRTGRVVYAAQAEPTLLDYIPKNTTSQAAVVYMYESTFTNNAAEIKEGDTDAALYGEAALDLTEHSLTVRKFAVFLPITDEQLEDVTYVREYVNRRLTLMLNQRVESQCLTGDGTAPNILGVLNWNVGQSSVNTQAIGTDTAPDAIHKAITKVRFTGRAEPTLCVLHPNDWQAIALLRDGEDRYLFGGPANPAPARIWGLPVVQTTYETENTGLVGDWAGYSEFVMRRGVNFQVSSGYSDYFAKGKQAIRADFRAVLVIYRGYAFCTVTGL